MVQFSCDKKYRKELAVIYRQEILQDISLFTSQPKARFYDTLFDNLDTSCMDEVSAETGRRGFYKAALLCAYIVMKCEGFSQIIDIMDYLNNNLLIAHNCWFNIVNPMLSYWTLNRFIRKLDNAVLKNHGKASFSSGSVG